MLERVLPGTVSCAETRSDVPGAMLFPEERAVIERAVEKRRAEFATARHCARHALAGLGLPPGPIPTGEKGAPAWPPGIVGSITHCDGYRGCAVAHAGDVAAIGIDAEPNMPLPAGLLGDIAAPEEARRLAALSELDTTISWDRLIFCMKEAVYKAWFPLARTWLGFEDATVTIDPENHAFEARLLVAGPTLGSCPLSHLGGRWVATDGLLLAGIALTSSH